MDAAGVYFARGTDALVARIVCQTLGRIYSRLETRPNFSEDESYKTSHHTSRGFKAQFPEPRPHSKERHPASPFLLFGVYLAKHSKLAATTLIQHGVLPLVSRLYDEPSLTTYRLGADDDMVVSGTSRRMMCQICYMLLVEIAKHCDLQDCIIKEELRQDIVATSRAFSIRYFGFKWWEIDDEGTNDLQVS